MNLQNRCPDCGNWANYIGLIYIVTDTGYVNKLFRCVDRKVL
jgi:hypothetical protein